ncbi:ATP-binding protein [Magnetospirillum fulvum]|nr:ATP-binding protein [Magnetospirillum fulvum]
MGKVWPLLLWFWVAALVGGWFAISAIRDHDEECRKAEARSQILVELAAVQTSRIFEGAEMAIDHVAIVLGESGEWEHHVRDLHTWRIIHNIGKALVSQPRLLAIDPAGIVRIRGEAFEAEPVSVADQDYFRHHLDGPSDRPYAGNPVVSPFSHTSVLTLSMRMNRPDGSLGGVIASSLSPGSVLGYFVALAKQEDVVFALLREDGTMLLRHPDAPAVIGTRFPIVLLTPHREGHEGTVLRVSPVDGVERITSFKRLDRFGLVLIAAIPVEAALAPWRHRTLKMAVLIGLGSLILTVLSVVLLRRRSERQRSAAIISESRSLLLEVQAVAQLGYYVYDMVADRWESSEILDSIFGIGPEDRRDAQGWLDLVVPEQKAEMAIYLDEIVAGKHDFDKEYRICRKSDGAVRWVVGLGKVERDETGRAIRMIGTIRDVTDKINAQEELSKKAEELARSNADLEQFAYVASHDLREPLRMVASYMRLLERRYGDSLNAEAHEFIAFAREGAFRMDKLVLDLLAYSRVGRVSDEPGPVRLDEVIECVLRQLADRIDESRAEINVVANLPIVSGHREELIRLFQNLIDNAIKYRASERPLLIQITARTDTPFSVITVADNGIGIEPDYFERIFVIFQRLHRHPGYEGTGIGLAICKKIAEQYGGRIWVDSASGNGAAFHIALKTAP